MNVKRGDGDGDGDDESKSVKMKTQGQQLGHSKTLNVKEDLIELDNVTSGEAALTEKRTIDGSKDLESDLGSVEVGELLDSAAQQGQSAKDETAQETVATGRIHVELLQHDGDKDEAQREIVVVADPTQRLSKQPGFDDLFFDLLFAAALSVYTNDADLSSSAQVGVFIGYFSLLWWTWWSQTLFDVRYRGREKVGFVMLCVQRLIRSALLGVWVAFATVTSEFARGSYTNFTTIYIVSRALLAADYLVIIVRSFTTPLQMLDSHIPNAEENRRKARFTPLVSHVIMIIGTVISIVFWVGSWYVTGDQTLPPGVIGMWIAGIAVEMIAEIVVEGNAALRSLSATPIVERMALFSLIVFGNGFERIGAALNQISPGSRDWTRGGIPFGGWGSTTIINAAASVVTVVLLFYGYFTRANIEFHAHPFRILLWSYVHLVLQVSSAVLMIGLGRVISFVNALTALGRFLEYPEHYLPNTTDWTTYIGSRNSVLNAFNDSDVDLSSVPSVQNYYDRRTLAVFVTTAALRGAQIPSIDVAMALVNSTVPFTDVKLSPTIHSFLQPYSGLLDSVQNPDGMDKFIEDNVYSFYFAYLCPAIFLIADVVVKAIQHWRGRSIRQSLGTTMICSLCIRLFFGLLLVAVQLIYYATLDNSDSSDSPIFDGLVLLACILLLEAILQLVCTHARAISHFVRRRALPVLRRSIRRRT